jgi:hypothetical protein
MNVNDLKGRALDAAVAKARGWKGVDGYWCGHPGHGRQLDGDPALHRNVSCDKYRPSTNWTQGGILIERERISLVYCEPGTTAGDAWEAYTGNLSPRRLDRDEATAEGPTPLIAAMRAFVASKARP